MKRVSGFGSKKITIKKTDVIMFRLSKKAVIKTLNNYE